MSETDQTPEEQKPEGKPETFTQADVDRIVAERLKRERETTKAKYADYDDLKAKAGEAKTAEERIANLEREIQASQREALRRRVQAAHGISDEDAELFLTGTDEDALTAQAKRLAGRDEERKQNGNHVPSEGINPTPQSVNSIRDFTRQMFADQ